MITTNVPRWSLLILVLTAALFWPLMVWAQEGGEGPAAPSFPEAAAPIYQARCANCHGPTGQGDGPEAVQAGLLMPDLTDPGLLRETTPARWFDIISNGVSGKAMPPFGDASSNPLRQVERWDLVFYVYTLGTPPAQVAMGQAFYETDCAECHGENGDGSAGTPGFTDLAVMANRSQADLFAAIANTDIRGHDLGLGEVEIWTLTDHVRTFSYNYSAPSVAAAPSTADAPLAASPFSGGDGVVNGRLINGTEGAAPPVGLEVRLRAFDMNAVFVDVITTTVAADGSFRFEGIDPTVPMQLEPMAVYQDVPYFGELDTAIALSPEQPEADVDMVVYETTDDASNIRIERLHIVFDFAPGQAQVAELYILSNDGDQTFVGTLEEGTLRLTVPADALGFQPGGDPNRYRTLADGIADTAPILPGQNKAESILVYNLAYDDEVELNRPMPYDVNKLTIFMPADAGLEVSGNGIQPGELFQAQGTALETYVADDLSAGDRLTLRVSGEPQVSAPAAVASPHGQPGPSQTQSIIIGAIAIVGAAALSYLYWQGHLTRLRPSAQSRQSTLLQAMADLDDDFEAGQLREKPYRARRAKLREELIELIKTEE
jgi:mono/diheme cytochrome c family protein